MNIDALFSSSTYDTSFGFSDDTCKVTSSSSSSCVKSSSNKLSPPTPCPRPGNSFAGGDQYLTPKRSISKPLRRRSRASKRTPTTLLNADPKNFRSLVQEFTGCRRLITSISFGNPRPRSRGPVNINFALGKEQAAYHMISANDHASNLQPLIDHNDYSPESQLQYNQQVANEEQECEFSLDSITFDPDLDDFLPTQKSSPCFPVISSGAEMQIPEGLVMDMDDLFFPCMNY